MEYGVCVAGIRRYLGQRHGGLGVHQPTHEPSVYPRSSCIILDSLPMCFNCRSNQRCDSIQITRKMTAYEDNDRMTSSDPRPVTSGTKLFWEPEETKSVYQKTPRTIQSVSSERIRLLIFKADNEASSRLFSASLATIYYSVVPHHYSQALSTAPCHESHRLTTISENIAINTSRHS